MDLILYGVAVGILFAAGYVLVTEWPEIRAFFAVIWQRDDVEDVKEKEQP